MHAYKIKISAIFHMSKSACFTTLIESKFNIEIHATTDNDTHPRKSLGHTHTKNIIFLIYYQQFISRKPPRYHNLLISLCIHTHRTI